MTEALDSQIIISGPVYGKLGEISRKVDYKILCSQTFDADRVQIAYYIPESMEERKDVALILHMLKAEKVSGIWNIRLSEEENSGLNIISDFIRIHSVVLDAIFVSHGMFFAYMRFNETEQEEVSDVVLRRIAMDDGYSVVYLGESPGNLNIMKSLSKEIQLFLIRIVSQPPSEELTSHNNPMGKTWKRVIKSVSPDDLINAVYLPAESISVPGFTTINEEMHLYEGSVKNQLLVYLNREFNKNGIVTFSRTQRIENDVFTMDFVIPEDQVNQSVKIMGKMFAMFPDWNCRIAFASRLEEVLETDLVLL